MEAGCRKEEAVHVEIRQCDTRHKARSSGRRVLQCRWVSFVACPERSEEWLSHTDASSEAGHNHDDDDDDVDIVYPSAKRNWLASIEHQCVLLLLEKRRPFPFRIT